MTSSVTAEGVLEGRTSSDGALVLSITGKLDTASTGRAWRDALLLVNRHRPRRLIVDASRLTYCDGAGAALLLELQRHQHSRRLTYEIQSLDPAYEALFELYERWDAQRPEPLARAESPIEQIGRATAAIWNDIVVLIAFVGQLFLALARAARHPRLVRWKDTFLTAELAGVNALPINGRPRDEVGRIIRQKTITGDALSQYLRMQLHASLDFVLRFFEFRLALLARR